MRYHRLGHVEPNVKVKKGDHVKKGQLVAFNGTGNGQWPAHCHYDILTYKPASWGEYVIGKSKQWVKDHYADPRGNERVVMHDFDHIGYGWLQDAQYAGGHAFHPGVDLNGPGSGNLDLGDKLYSPVDGVVEYVYAGTGKNSGWGPMVVILEQDGPSTTNFPTEVPKPVPQEPPSTTPGVTEVSLGTPSTTTDTNIQPSVTGASTSDSEHGVGVTVDKTDHKEEQWWRQLVDRLVIIIRSIFHL